MTEFQDQAIEWIEYPEHNNGEALNKGYIYSLYNQNDEILYVGQTAQLDARIKAHYFDKPDVLYAKYLEVHRDELNECEAMLILKYLPRYNRTLPKNNAYWTVDAYQKRDIRFYYRRIDVLRLAVSFSSFRGYYHVSDLEKISRLLDNLEVSE